MAMRASEVNRLLKVIRVNRRTIEHIRRVHFAFKNRQRLQLVYFSTGTQLVWLQNYTYDFYTLFSCNKRARCLVYCCSTNPNHITFKDFYLRSICDNITIIIKEKKKKITQQKCYAHIGLLIVNSRIIILGIWNFGYCAQHNRHGCT